MAQRVRYDLVDDIDETPASETVRFGLDGVSYEIDLSDENAATMRDALAPYIGAARRTGGRRTKMGVATSRSSSATDIRAWAADNGYEVSPRGRVPAVVREAYEKANG